MKVLGNYLIGQVFNRWIRDFCGYGIWLGSITRALSQYLYSIKKALTLIVRAFNHF